MTEFRVSDKSFQRLLSNLQDVRLPGRTADSAPAVSEAATTAADHGPKTLDEYVGQARVRRRLQVAVASALARGDRAEHIFIDGEAGLGKTTLAILVAAMLDRPIVTLTQSPQGDELREACEKVDFGVLFVDEVHLWSNAAEHELMTLTGTGMLATQFGDLPYPCLTVIAATTERGKIGKPLLDRFGCQVKLDRYTDAEMTEIALGIVKRCWPSGYEPLDEAACAILAVAAAKVPRNLRSLIFAGRDLALAGEPVSAAEILLLCDTDPDGCTRAHLDMLNRLNDSPRGTAGLTALAGALRTPEEVLRRTEQLLIDRDYVVALPSGRAITPKGRKRLKDGSIRDAAA